MALNRLCIAFLAIRLFENNDTVNTHYTLEVKV